MQWPKSFLLKQKALLTDQLEKYKKWNKQTAGRLRSTDYVVAVGGNEADCAHIFIDTEVDCISIECSRQIILKIQTALSLISTDLRKSSNHYGLCLGEGCGLSIGIKRLRAMPWADLCVQCQEKEEVSGKNHTSPGAGANSRGGVHRSRTIAAKPGGIR